MANHATKAKFPTACNKSYGIPEIKYAGMISIEMECRALNETIQSNKKAEKKANEAKIFMLILFYEIRVEEKIDPIIPITDHAPA